jgi:hypothetical protein
LRALLISAMLAAKTWAFWLFRFLIIIKDVADTWTQCGE